MGRAPRRLASTPRQIAEWKRRRVPEESTYHVIVVGGGLGGVAAALAAARLGCSVLLLEPTHLLGGQAGPAAVTAMDEIYRWRDAQREHGLWRRIVAALHDVYTAEFQRPLDTCHYCDDHIAANVPAADLALSRMLASGGVEVVRNLAITGVVRDGDRLSGVLTRAGLTRADVVIDASEDGHVCLMAGVPHRLGNGVVGDWEHPAPDLTAGVQDITWVAVVRKYPGGIPEQLTMRTPPPMYDVFAPRFRLAYPPEGWRKGGAEDFAGYRGMPDPANVDPYRGSDWERVTRTSLNRGNDTPITAAYFADHQVRREYDTKAVFKTLALIYYLQEELGLSWSVATDEGFDIGREMQLDERLVPFAGIVKHFAVIPYQRESRRILGVATLTGRNIWRKRNRAEAEWRDDVVAVGHYTIDLHGGRKFSDLEQYLGETLSDKPADWTEGPFPIPLGSLIPRSVDGFLAAEKQISQTRLANGATRLHPTVTAIGEASGTLAALAVRNAVPPRAVPASLVQLTLGEHGALLAPARIEGITPDNPLFATVNLAVARSAVAYKVHRSSKSDWVEPWVVVDVREAVDAGQAIIADLSAWYGGDVPGPARLRRGG